jgi:hypothetical protein
MTGMPKRFEPRGGGSERDTVMQANAKHTAKPWLVLAVSATGKRTYCGRFATRLIAERHAEILRRVSRITDGDAIVEREAA